MADGHLGVETEKHADVEPCRCPGLLWLSCGSARWPLSTAGPPWQAGAGEDGQGKRSSLNYEGLYFLPRDANGALTATSTVR